MALTSDGTGTSGLGTTGLPAQTVSITAGGVYRLAAPALGPTTFNMHVGSPGTEVLTIANTAANDGWSESLDASFGSVTGGLVPSGSVGLLASGGSSAAMSLTLSTSAVGSQSGNVTVNFTSDGIGTSGLGLTPLVSQSTSVTGNVYRLAAPGALAPLSFGNVHVGATQALVIANTAANDGWSESLDASFGSVTGGLVPSGSVGLLASGGSSAALSLAASAAGPQGGNVTVNFISDGTGTSGLGLTPLGSQTISVAGNAYRLAAPGALAPISFGNVHVGATVAQQALLIANAAANDGWSESLDASFGSVAAGFVSSGSVGLLASGGSSAAMSLAMVTSAAGLQGGNVTINFISDGTGTSGLGLTPLGSQTISVTGNVYSGQGVWNTNGGGSWTDFSKWTTLGGVPGIDGPLSAGDTALFGPALGFGSATVSLNGASPHVSSLTFNSAASYIIAQGIGGTLNLDAGAGTATVAVLSGNHAITSPVTLASNASFAQSAGSSLTISGDVGESGGSRALTQAGPGLLVLGGANSYSGATTVSGGVLKAANSNTLSSNSDAFVSGGTLDVTAGPQTVRSLTIGPAGTLNVSVGNLLTCTNAATFGNGALNIANYAPGTTEELIAYGSHANPGSDSFLLFTVDGSGSTGYQLEYLSNELEIAPAPNASILVPSTTALNFGRVLSTAIGTLPISVGLSSGTTTSTGATASVLTGGLQGAYNHVRNRIGGRLHHQLAELDHKRGVDRRPWRAQRHGGGPKHRR